MRVVVVGDTVLDRPPAEPTAARSALRLLGRADLTVANLEAALVDHDRPAEKEMTLRVATANAQRLREIGVDVVSLATNHAMDHGIDGLRSTIAALDAAGVGHAGGGHAVQAAAGHRHRGADGTTVAVLSFCCTLPPGANATTSRPGVAALRIRQSLVLDGALLEEQPGTPPVLHTEVSEADLAHVERVVADAAAHVDRVLVCVHWGVPFAYLPPNQGPLARYQQPLGRRLIDAGADVVVGTHPHCLHPVERWNGGLILYSLGNFLFHAGQVQRPPSYQPLPYRADRLFGTRPWRDSAVFELEFRPDAHPAVRVVPIVLDDLGEPYLADEADAARIRADLQEMTREIHADSTVAADGTVRFGA